MCVLKSVKSLPICFLNQICTGRNTENILLNIFFISFTFDWFNLNENKYLLLFLSQGKGLR